MSTEYQSDNYIIGVQDTIGYLSKYGEKKYSYDILREMESSKKLVSYRTPNNARYYTIKQLDAYLDGKYSIEEQQRYLDGLVALDYSSNSDFSIEQASNILGKSIRTLYRYEESGKLVPFIRNDKKYYTAKMLEAFIRGEYDADKQEEYNHDVALAPVEFRFNLDSLELIEDVSDEDAQYYKIEQSENFSSAFNVLEVVDMSRLVTNSNSNRRGQKANTRYSLGRITESSTGEKEFESVVICTTV